MTSRPNGSVVEGIKDKFCIIKDKFCVNLGWQNFQGLYKEPVFISVSYKEISLLPMRSKIVTRKDLRVT